MAIRTAHGTGASALVRVETAPADELPDGMPADADRVSRSADRERGRFGPGNRRSVLGGRAKRGKARLTSRLGLAELPEGNAFRPYKAAAATFRRVQCAELARTVGGGVCGPGPSSIVASASLALAWSRYLSDCAATEGDAELAVRAIRLGDSSRQALLTAHELCAREAAARPRAPADAQAELRARLLGDVAEDVAEEDEPTETSAPAGGPAPEVTEP